MGKIIHLYSKENISVFDVAQAFLSFRSMSLSTLQKLCYYTQCWYLVFYQETLFNEDFIATEQGLVSLKLEKQFTKYQQKKIVPKKCFPFYINKKASDVIKEVYRIYGNLSEEELEILVKNEQPWIKAIKQKEKHFNSVIDVKQMQHFYSNLYKKNKQTK
ncbi:MAG: Panacea domain-containing protein [bacterium]